MAADANMTNFCLESACCNTTEAIPGSDFFALVTGCAIASFLGFFGSVYVILSSIGVIVRLQARLRHRLWHYLLNGGFLIILLACGEGMLGFVLYKSSMNAAIFGPYWGTLENKTTECSVTARVIQFAVWLELLSIMFLGACFHEILGRRRNITPRLCAIYISAALLGSGLMTLIPSAAGQFGPLQLWCWIASNTTDASTSLQWAYYYAEIFAACVALVVITVLPLRRWRHIRRDPNKRQLAVRMILFPVVWLICKLPALVDRAYQLFTGGEHLVGLTFIHAVTIPTMGFFDALVYAGTSAKMQEFFTSLKFRITTNRNLRTALLQRQSAALAARPYSAPQPPRQRRSGAGAGGARRGGVVSMNNVRGSGGDARASAAATARRPSSLPPFASSSSSRVATAHSQSEPSPPASAPPHQAQHPRQRERSTSHRLEPVARQGRDVEELLDKVVLDRNQVQLQELVGHGSTGQVYKGLFRGKVVALRERFEDPHQAGQTFQRLMDEASTMLFMRHPYVVNFYGLWEQPCDVITRTFLVSEFCEQQLPRRLIALREEQRQLTDELASVGSAASRARRGSAAPWWLLGSPSRRRMGTGGSRGSRASTAAAAVNSKDDGDDDDKSLPLPRWGGHSGPGEEPSLLVDAELKLKWCRQLADALKYLHTRSPPLAHCAVRPSHVLLTASDDVRLSDFSAAFSGETQLVEAGAPVVPEKWDARFTAPEVLRAVRATLDPDNGGGAGVAGSSRSGRGGGAAAVAAAALATPGRSPLAAGDGLHAHDLSLAVPDGMAWDVYSFAMTAFFVWTEAMPFAAELRHGSAASPGGGDGGALGVGLGGVGRGRSSSAATVATEAGLLAPHESLVGLDSEIARQVMDQERRPKLPRGGAMRLAPTALLERLWAPDRDARPGFEDIATALRQHTLAEEGGQFYHRRHHDHDDDAAGDGGSRV